MDVGCIKELHDGWLQHVKHPQAGLAEPSAVSDGTVCHNCRQPLNPRLDFGCDKCNRLVCSRCGACMCGKTDYDRGLQEGTVKPWMPEAIVQGRRERQAEQIEALHKALEYRQVQLKAAKKG